MCVCFINPWSYYHSPVGSDQLQLCRFVCELLQVSGETWNRKFPLKTLKLTNTPHSGCVKASQVCCPSSDSTVWWWCHSIVLNQLQIVVSKVELWTVVHDFKSVSSFVQLAHHNRCVLKLKASCGSGSGSVGDMFSVMMLIYMKIFLFC